VTLCSAVELCALEKLTHCSVVVVVVTNTRECVDTKKREHIIIYAERLNHAPMNGWLFR
jgi:hypothetical protein